MCFSQGLSIQGREGEDPPVNEYSEQGVYLSLKEVQGMICISDWSWGQETFKLLHIASRSPVTWQVAWVGSRSHHMNIGWGEQNLHLHLKYYLTYFPSENWHSSTEDILYWKTKYLSKFCIDFLPKRPQLCTMKRWHIKTDIYYDFTRVRDT